MSCNWPMSVPLPITNSVLRVVHIHAALCAGALFSSPGSNQCENWWECVMLTWCEIKVNIYTYLMWGQDKSSEVTARDRFILLCLIISRGRLSSGLSVTIPGTRHHKWFAMSHRPFRNTFIHFEDEKGVRRGSPHFLKCDQKMTTQAEEKGDFTGQRLVISNQIWFIADLTCKGTHVWPSMWEFAI